MSDVNSTVNGNCENNKFCVDTNRVYDSCGDKDCLSNLRVFFSEENQAIIAEATAVRIREANIINTTVLVTPITYHNGFYAVDMTFYFEVMLDVNVSTSTAPTTISGLSVYSKRVILYGGEGRIGVFTSDNNNLCVTPDNLNLPTAKVQVAQPMALSASLETLTTAVTVPANIPDCVLEYFDETFVDAETQSVLATIGVFSIVQLQRSAQLLIPAGEYCVPGKECVSTTDNPCDMFSKVDFPKDQFFPPNLIDKNCDKASSCQCKCCEE